MASFDKGLYVYISRIQNIVSPVVLAFGVTIIGVLTDAPLATTFNTQKYIRLCGIFFIYKTISKNAIKNNRRSRVEK